MHMKTFFTIVISVSLLVLPVSARAFQGTPTFNATPTSVDMGPVAVGVPTPFFGLPPPFFQPLQISNSGTAPRAGHSLYRLCVKLPHPISLCQVF
jgi:hypothetical protein